MSAKQETYDVAEWSERLCVALDDMAANEKPGVAKRGGKRAVLQAMKEKIREVLAAGYHPQQIAEVLKRNGLVVLPKSITETVREAKPVVKRTPRRIKKEAPQSASVNGLSDAVANAEGNAQASAEPIASLPPVLGSFEIQPDTKAL